MAISDAVEPVPVNDDALILVVLGGFISLFTLLMYDLLPLLLTYRPWSPFTLCKKLKPGQ